jgi:hypothetical protein
VLDVMRSKARTLFEIKHFAGLAVVLSVAILVACLFVGTNLFYNRGDVSDKALNISPRDRGHTCAFTSRNRKGK